MVILSALVERFTASQMRDFFTECIFSVVQKYTLEKYRNAKYRNTEILITEIITYKLQKKKLITEIN